MTVETIMSDKPVSKNELLNIAFFGLKHDDNSLVPIKRGSLLRDGHKSASSYLQINNEPAQDELKPFGKEVCQVVMNELEEKTQELLAEQMAALSLWLQDRFTSQDVPYTLLGANLTQDNLFGINGLLVIFLVAMDSRLKGENLGISWSVVSNKKAKAELTPRFEGNLLDLESLTQIRDVIVDVVNEIKVTEIDGKKCLSVDELYHDFFEKWKSNGLQLLPAENVLTESASEVAQKLLEQKSFVAAEELFRKVLHIRVAILGTTHLSTLTCQQCVADCLLGQEKSLEAQTLLKSSIDTLTQVFGDDHEDTLMAQWLLARLSRRQGETMLANEILSLAFCKAMAKLGEDHEVTLKLENDLRESHMPIALPNDSELTIHVCDEKAFQKRLKQETEKYHEKKLFSLTRITKPKRLQLISPNVFSEIERIGEEQPNFAEVTELILTTLHSQAITGRAAQLPPMLLTGAPGVGKTRYIKRIAAALKLPFIDIQLAGVADAYKICGLSRYWGSGGTGLVVNTFVENDVANPVFLLDEIDKTRKSEQTDPLAVILLLLEKESSRYFKDSFLDLPLDVSHASFIATANDISELPEPLLSRFYCIEVQALDSAGRCTMVNTVYSELLVEEQLLNHLARHLPEGTIDMLASSEVNGRELKREILLGMRRACREFKLGNIVTSKIELTLEYFRLKECKPTRSIGFMRC